MALVRLSIQVLSKRYWRILWEGGLAGASLSEAAHCPLSLGRSPGLPAETSPFAPTLLPGPQGFGAAPGSGHVSHPMVHHLDTHGPLAVRTEVLTLGSLDQQLWRYLETY